MYGREKKSCKTSYHCSFRFLHLLTKKRKHIICETLIKLFSHSFCFFHSLSMPHTKSRKRFSFKRCETNLIKTFPMFKIEFNYIVYVRLLVRWSVCVCTKYLFRQQISSIQRWFISVGLNFFDNSLVLVLTRINSVIPICDTKCCTQIHKYTKLGVHKNDFRGGTWIKINDYYYMK